MFTWMTARDQKQTPRITPTSIPALPSAASATNSSIV